MVQAYKLPKYQHVVPSAGPSSSYTTNSRSRTVPDSVDPVLAVPESEAAVDVLALQANEDDRDGDVDMESSSPIAQPQFGRNNGVPLTMRELAEIAAQSSQNSPRPLVDDEYPRPPLNANATSVKMSANSRSTQLARSSASSLKSTPSSSVNGTTSKPKRRRPPAKRVRDPDEDTSSISDTNISSPSKRGRNAATSSVPAQTRTLRPRVSKSNAQIEEEKQMERAFKKAVAQ